MSLVPLPLVLHTVCALTTWSSSSPLLSPRFARARVRQLAPVRAAVALNATEEEEDNGWSDFLEVGGEYELDMEELEQLQGLWEKAEERWAKEGGRGKLGGVLDDKGSFLSKWWYDPAEGPNPEAEARRAATAQFKRRVDLVARPTLVGAGLALGACAPTSVARLSARFGLAIHLAVPLLRIIGAKIAQALPSNAAPMNARLVTRPGDLPQADATLVVAAQHLTGAAAVLVVSAALWSSGSWYISLLFASIGRLALLPGMWLWSDLNEELKNNDNPLPRPITPLQIGARVWRLLAAALCLAEAALLYRTSAVLAAVWPTAAVSQGARAAMLSIAPLLGAAGPSLLARGGPLLLVGGSAPALLESSASRVLGLTSLSGVLLIFLYFLHWFAFVYEAGERDFWRARLLPRMREAAPTASGALVLSGLRIAKPSPSVNDLLRAHSLLSDTTGAEAKRWADAAKEDAEYERGRAAGFILRKRQQSAFDREDERLMQWALSGELDDDNEARSGIGATIVQGFKEPAPSETPSVGEIFNAPVSTQPALEPDDDWAYLEMAKMLLTEDGVYEKQREKVEARGEKMPDAWTFAEADKNVNELMKDLLKKAGKDVDNDPSLLERMRMQFSLEKWAADQPADFVPPKRETYEEAAIRKEKGRMELKRKDQKPLNEQLSESLRQRQAEGMAASPEDPLQLGKEAQLPNAGDLSDMLKEDMWGDEDDEEDAGGEEPPIFV